MTTMLTARDADPMHDSEVWAEAIGSSFVPLKVRFKDPTSFVGSIATDRLGGIGVAVVRAAPHEATRTPQLVERSDEGYFKLGMPLCGQATLRQDGREAVVEAGDLVLFDTSRPYELVDETGAIVVLMLSQSTVPLPAKAMRTLTARSFSGTSGVGILVTPLLRSLADNFERLSTMHSPRIADHVLDLMTTLLAEQLAADGVAPDDPGGLLLTQVHAFIEANLTDPWLSPDTIAAGCHISTGYLHRIFRAEGTTISRLIRARRLDLCRKHLLSPAHAAEPVGSIGAQFGFYDAGHFSRVFKAEFGMSPRAYRAAHSRGLRSAPAGARTTDR